MPVLDGLLQRKIESLSKPLAVVMPDGHRIGPPNAVVTLSLRELSVLAHVATGEIGTVAEDIVEGRLGFEGTVRDLMAVAAEMLGEDPTQVAPANSPLTWWREARLGARSRGRHRPETDARQIEFHYDVSDEFYQLWLDPRRIYSCAYFREPSMRLDQAQEAKIDHICRKLRLQPGERFLDVGAGWGGLLLWAAEHYGVEAHGITLSHNQHAHVNRLIAERGLQDRVRMELLDYRDLPEAPRALPYDKIASVGMFEHVGRAQLPAYFAKLRRLLRPGGLLLNHGITAGGTRNHQLGAGIGEFIDRYVSPRGPLQHVYRVTEVMREPGFEPLDLENLRPHYARTLWAWSDALEAQLDAACRVAAPKVVQAYRLYLAGSAMGFERGWMCLYQMLASRPTGEPDDGPVRGAQCD